MAEKERGFKAKKVTPQGEVDVTNQRAVITPDSKNGLDKRQPATVNFNINGVSPIALTDYEMDAFWKWAIPIARRAPNLQDVTPEKEEIDAQVVEP